MRSGQLGGAGFDVTTPEPPPNDHPLVQLLDLPNFILTPQVGWASEEAIQGLADQLIDNIEAFHRGAPRNVAGGQGYFSDFSFHEGLPIMRVARPSAVEVKLGSRRVDLAGRRLVLQQQQNAL